MLAGQPGSSASLAEEGAVTEAAAKDAGPGLASALGSAGDGGGQAASQGQKTCPKSNPSLPSHTGLIARPPVSAAEQAANNMAQAFSAPTGFLQDAQALLQPPLLGSISRPASGREVPAGSTLFEAAAVGATLSLESEDALGGGGTGTGASTGLRPWHDRAKPKRVESLPAELGIGGCPHRQALLLACARLSCHGHSRLSVKLACAVARLHACANPCAQPMAHCRFSQFVA